MLALTPCDPLLDYLRAPRRLLLLDNLLFLNIIYIYESSINLRVCLGHLILFYQFDWHIVDCDDP